MVGQCKGKYRPRREKTYLGGLRTVVCVAL